MPRGLRQRLWYSRRRASATCSGLLRDALDDLFADKVGAEYKQDRWKKICSEAQDRFNRKIPPGYEDDKKGGQKYGDVILWCQLKDHAGKLKKPLVLITDDRKADWWQEHEGKTIGPRPELIHEMKSDAGIQFYMYQPDLFMEYAQKHLGIKGDQSVEEVREIMQQDEADVAAMECEAILEIPIDQFNKLRYLVWIDGRNRISRVSSQGKMEYIGQRVNIVQRNFDGERPLVHLA